MSLDSGIALFTIGFLAVVFLIRLAAIQTARHQSRQVFQFWQRVGLPMGTERVNETLKRRLRRSANAALLGGLAGALLAAAVLVLLPEPLLSFNFTWLVALPAILIGTTLFDVALTLRDSLFGPRPDEPRMARAMAVSAADYMSPWRLKAAPSLLLLAGLLAVAGLLLGWLGRIDLPAFLRSPALVSLVVAIVVQALCAAVGRRLLAQPQPVAEALELAWDDAIRADTFRKLGLLATVVAWLSFSAVALGVLAGTGGGGNDSMPTVVSQVLGMWGYFAILLAFNYGGACNYFRHRLWAGLTHAVPSVTSGP